MKNSEENKPEQRQGLSLSSIDEHRISLGLLTLVLLSGAGYGIWMLVSPLLPASAAATSESRKQRAEAFLEAEQWNEALPIYREMLADDPDNGFAMQKIARIREEQLFVKWRQLGKIIETTGKSSASTELLDQEALFFESVTKCWRGLLDNARFQKRAYLRLATLHAYRSKYANETEELEITVKLLREMLDNGFTTSQGIGSMKSFRLLKDHPDFERLVGDEKRNKNFRPRRPEWPNFKF